MQKHCNLILLAGFSATIFSGNIEANEDKSDTAHAENSYWSLTPQSWALFVATSNDRQEISLSLPEKNKHNQRINIELSPNINHLIRVGMQYQGYALSARVATIEQNSGISKTDIGATRARDWQLRSFGEHWSYELVYQRHQGFYYLDDDKNIHFNEQLLSKKSAITAIYNFNPERLNLNAAYAFTHHQERSGYAYFLYSNIKRMELNATNGIATPSIITVFPSAEPYRNLSEFSVTSIAVGGGIGGTYVFGHQRWFVSGLLLLGGAAQRQIIHTTERHTEWSVEKDIGIKLAFAYRYGQHTTGLNAQGALTEATVDDDYVIGFSSLTGGVYYAYLF